MVAQRTSPTTRDTQPTTHPPRLTPTPCATLPPVHLAPAHSPSSSPRADRPIFLTSFPHSLLHHHHPLAMAAPTDPWNPATFPDAYAVGIALGSLGLTAGTFALLFFIRVRSFQARRVCTLRGRARSWNRGLSCARRISKSRGEFRRRFRRGRGRKGWSSRKVSGLQRMRCKSADEVAVVGKRGGIPNRGVPKYAWNDAPELRA